MSTPEVVIGLIFVATILAALAQRIGVAYPIVLVLGGLLISLVPGMPTVQLDPEVAFLVFIPPLVYLPASQIGLRDVQSKWSFILMLSVGLVLATLFGVAALAHSMIAGFSWSTSFLLAAIVAPTDLIAVMAITRRNPLPRRIVNVLDGEGLLNDVIAFTAYKIAVQSVAQTAYGVPETVLQLAWDLVAGIGAGLAVGWVAIWVRRRVHDPAINSAASLLTSFAAYLTSEAIGGSGVLATVTAGLCVGQSLSRILQPDARQSTTAFWGGLNFILEGLAFILIGFELRPTLARLSLVSPWQLARDAALVTGAVIALRVIWVVATIAVLRFIGSAFKTSQPRPSWRNAAIVAWAGPRGIESLAAAIGIPLLLPDGVSPFPQREMILFLSFGVILSTLLFQGATLPCLIRWLKPPSDNSEQEEENLAHLAAARAALDVLNHPLQTGDDLADVVPSLRSLYEQKVLQYENAASELNRLRDAPLLTTSTTLRLKILHAQREAVIALRDQGLISMSVLRRLERSFDLEEIRLTS